MFEVGLSNVVVVLGDSNLKVDLPFGVQTLQADTSRYKYISRQFMEGKESLIADRKYKGLKYPFQGG